MKTGLEFYQDVFGFFNINNNDYTVAEIEEICISNSTLSFSDYLKARKLDFFVNVFFTMIYLYFGSLNYFVKKNLIFLYGIGFSFYFKNIKVTDFKKLVSLFIEEDEG